MAERTSMSGKPTFEEIKKAHQLTHAEAGGHGNFTYTEWCLRNAKAAHRNSGHLIEMVETLKHLAHPHAATIDKRPLVLYFENEEDRQGFVETCQEVNPNWRAVKVP